MSPTTVTGPGMPLALLSHSRPPGRGVESNLWGVSMPANPAVHRSVIESESPGPQDFTAASAVLDSALREQDEQRLRLAFQQLEVMLCSGSGECRSGAIELLEKLQDSATWLPQTGDPYPDLMGPHTRSLWSALHAIRSDLAECSVLEAEVAMWRLVHHP